MPSTAQTPPIRSFQFDANAVANIRSSINMFRADVNLTETLFTMPARSQNQGMDVNVTIQYQSNVYTQAMLWNRDAPTGTLGLGWTLPRTAIVLEQGGALSAGARRYAYSVNGGQTPMVREPQTPQLFAMPGALAGQLVVGQPVPPEIVRLFGAHGFSLSASATISAGAIPKWEIDDPEELQGFVLRLDGELVAFDGGEAYQLQSYQFWKILYYPKYERWLTIDETGLRMSYGGLHSGVRGGAMPGSLGDSVEWRVGWATDGGKLLWNGASGLTEGQTHYAVSWNLASISNLWGDKILYGYNEQWPVNPQTGLRPVVEQAVAAPQSGSTGLGYTKACYLTSVIDVFGRRLEFTYDDKLWDDPSPEAPREYADPHKRRPDNMPNAWQDSYETQYLHEITVSAANGEGLLSAKFVYAPRPNIEGPTSQVANVSNNTGAQYGDSFKRFLTAIVFRTSEGLLMGTMGFDYWLDTPDQAPPGYSPGAIRKVVYPGGATAAWTYTQQFLTSCQRSLTVMPPDGLDESSTPTVWFGPDYAVSLWYNGIATRLTLQVHSWNGRWITWQLNPEPAAIFDDPRGFTPSSLSVMANRGCLSVSFDTQNTKQVYLFTKDIARPGQWTPAVLNGATTGLNQPTLSYNLDSADVSPPLGGQSFVLITRMDTTYKRYALDRLTWRWTTGVWTQETAELPQYTWVTAGADYYLTVDKLGSVLLRWLEGGLNWCTGGQTTLPDMEDVRPSDLVLVSGDSLVAVSRLRTNTRQTIAYTIYPLQWDAGYGFRPFIGFPFSDAQDPSGANPTSWMPEIAADSQIACAGHLLRFNGQRWLINSTLSPLSVLDGEQQRYAYGPDVAVQVLSTGQGPSQVSAKVLAYDPNTDVISWNQVEAASPAVPLRNPESQAVTANFPSFNSDFLVIGPWLYFRGTSSDWSEVVGEPPVCNLEVEFNRALASKNPGRWVINSEALINEAPGFLACGLYDSTAVGQRSGVVLLENGRLSTSVGNPVLLPEGEQISLSTAPGSGAAGPSMFVTYPAEAGSFRDAPRFTLNQYVGNAVNGELMHYAVTGFIADNGFDDPKSSTLVQDLATATCDSSGTVFKYYQCQVFPGSRAGNDGGAPKAPPYGSVKVNYLNGLDDQTGDNFYDMLDGLLSRVEVFDADGTPLTRTELSWRVWAKRSPDPSDATIPPVNLAGGYVCKTGVKRFSDGILSCAVISALGEDRDGVRFAAPWSNQPVAKWITAPGASGKVETEARSTLYGCECDPVLRALNILSAEAMNVSSVAVEDGPQIPLSADAYSRGLWSCARGEGVLAPGLRGSYSWQGLSELAYPFDGPDQHEDPAGWRLDQRVVTRTPLGLPSEWSDPLGVITSVQYVGESLPAAQITNASSRDGQWAYDDFEAEDLSNPWQATGAVVQTKDAYVGRHSLCLPAGANASLAATVAPVSNGQPYLLAFAMKTAPGYATSADAGWMVEVRLGDEVVGTFNLPFATTEGVWTWRSKGIALPRDPTAALSITATARNITDQSVWLDAVTLAPLHSDLQAQSFDKILRQPISSLSGAGRQSLTAYNRLSEPVASLGPDDQVLQLTQNFLSPLGNHGVFNPASPGASLTLQAAGPSHIELFRAGNEWKVAWMAAPEAGWQVQPEDMLSFSGSSGTLSFNGWGEAVPATAALFVELYAPQGLTGSLGWTFDDDYRLGWNSDLGRWVFEGPEGFIPPLLLAMPSVMPLQWLVLFGEGVLLVFGDGQLIYSLDWTQGVPSSLVLETGQNSLEVRNLAVMTTPRLSLSYLDGAGVTRQSQTLHRADARLEQSVQDTLGRVLATTKPAPARFGHDAGLPLMAYHPNLVDVPAFLAATTDTWKMQGDVADFWAGQTIGGITRSDDQGYPYIGSRYEASPRQRVLEAGQPGRRLAIHDILTLDEGERLTTQYLYGATNNGYLTRGSLDPLKTLTTRVNTVTRQTVATKITDVRGQTANQTTTQAQYQNAQPGPAGQRQTKRLPNLYSSPPQGGADAFINVVNGDALGQPSQADGPDSGEVQILYDPAGRWRFLQPTLDPGEIWFLYAKYDALGRQIEEGLVLQPWDEKGLAQIAATDPAYPQVGSGVPFRTSRRTCWDGSGDDPHQIGQKVEISTWTSAPDEAGEPWLNVERFTYDAQGNPIRVEQAVSLPGAPVAVTRYRYNALGQPTQVTLPEGAPLGGIRYDYDDLGQVVKVSTVAGIELARYNYAISGAVTAEQLNGGRLVQRYTFDSPGWLISQNLTVAEQDSAWAIETRHDPTGLVCARAERLSLKGGEAEATETIYKHNALGQLELAVANGSHPGHWQAESYDANGNLWAASVDAQSLNFTGQSGTDKLVSSKLGPAPEITLAYDARGQMVSAGGLGLIYDHALALASGISREVAGKTAKLRLGYGGQQQRTVKQVSSAGQDFTRLYVCGTGTEPLAIWQDGAWTSVVTGPTGLLAVGETGDRLGFALKDTQSSVRAVVDDKGTLLARYRYGVFGAVVESRQSLGQVFPWRFMGQEWDGEVGLYNFKARLYDPALCRFLQPDPGGQYASPYVFVGDDPVSMTDPDGGSAHWAQLGVDALSAAVVVGGLALTPFTGGVSDEFAAAIDASLLTESGITMGVEESAEFVGEDGAEEVMSSGVKATRSEGSIQRSSASKRPGSGDGGRSPKSLEGRSSGKGSGGGGDGGKTPTQSKGLGLPEQGERVRCRATGRDGQRVYGYNFDNRGVSQSNRNWQTLNITLSRGPRRGDAARLTGALNALAPRGARGLSRTAYSCAEVNAITQLLALGMDLNEITLERPEVLRDGVWVPTYYCESCQTWIRSLRADGRTLAYAPCAFRPGQVLPS